MRVLVTADAVGGVWTYALDLAAGLRARGDDPVLAVLGPPASSDQAEAAQCAGLRLIDTGLPLEWTAADEAELGEAARELSRLASAEQVRLVHLSNPALAADARFAMTVVGVAHSCLATWWAAVREGPPPAEYAWRIAATARGYAACDVMIAPSAAHGGAVRRTYGVDPLVARNGRATPLRRVAGRDIPVTTAGRLWDEGKGAATLDAAAQALDAPILAFGPASGPQGQRIVLPHLRLAGTRPQRELEDALGRTQVFASASLYEPFGLAVLEAAQAGCALVLSDIPTFRELWEGAALFVTPGDAGAFAAAIGALLRDRPERDRLATAALVRASRYDLSTFVDTTRAIYRAALRPAGRAEAAA